MKPYKIIIIGAGGRGMDYSQHLVNMPEKFEIVGIAEPIEDRRNNLKNLFQLSENQCFSSWEDIFAVSKFAPSQGMFRSRMLLQKNPLLQLDLLL